MASETYPSDLTDDEWGLLEPHLPSPKRRGRPRLHSPREILDAVFYLLKTGCQWRMLPRGFRPLTTSPDDPVRTLLVVRCTDPPSGPAQLHEWRHSLTEGSQRGRLRSERSLPRWETIDLSFRSLAGVFVRVILRPLPQRSTDPHQASFWGRSGAPAVERRRLRAQVERRGLVRAGVEVPPGGGEVGVAEGRLHEMDLRAPVHGVGSRGRA